MKFDIYFPMTSRAGKLVPGVKPHRMTWAEIYALCGSPQQKELIAKVRACTDKDEKAALKQQVPAICAVGDCTKTRAIRNMVPTGLYMIDIDHVENPLDAFDSIRHEAGEEYFARNVLAAHVTVGGKGLRFFLRAQEGCNTLIENMEAFAKKFELGRFGDFDAPCKDFSRISFLPTDEDFLYQNADLALEGERPWDDGYLVNDWKESDIIQNSKLINSKSKIQNGKLFSDAEILENWTDEEIAEFENYDFRGTPLKVIIERYVQKYGKPGKAEVHNYYNAMIADFKYITSNNKRCLFYLLPRFGHDAAECWSQIKSICARTTGRKIPEPFYCWLKDNGFIKEGLSGTDLAEYMMSDTPEKEDAPIPWLPPVFREFIKITPKDFRVSMVNALLPAMGTLTSYLQGRYFNDEVHTTSFYSVIYAPPGTGKSFARKVQDNLFGLLKLREYIQTARETIYQNQKNIKGDNEHKPEDPHTLMRIFPPKNSETELLMQMRDNCGYHMFTYAPEMDSWAKGVRAAGGNKDDMIRVAWDNEWYGQAFAGSPFKGEVQLFWNVLITGTIQQLFSYYKNVENGLITRCSFTTIDNQQYAALPVWKPFAKKDKEVLKRFMERCDSNSYEEPAELLPDRETVDSTSEENFDKEINWRFHFKKRKEVDMAWVLPTIGNWLEVQRKQAAQELNVARDVFRKRVAVRGFRIGLICMALWENPRKSDLEKCIPFIEWWMNQDIESSLSLWGQRYNAETQTDPALPQKNVFNELPEVFDKQAVYIECTRQGVRTPIKGIIYLWKQNGLVEKTDKNHWKKIIKSK